MRSFFSFELCTLRLDTIISSIMIKCTSLAWFQKKIPPFNILTVLIIYELLRNHTTFLFYCYVCLLAILLQVVDLYLFSETSRFIFMSMHLQFSNSFSMKNDKNVAP
ncbi:hypothetical protein VPH35_045059 [Triticum aestivum]